MFLRTCKRHMTYITCLVALCASISFTVLFLFAGIAAACEGGGGTGCTEAPSATTQAASSVESTYATLNGSVNPHGCETTYVFKYGLTTSYGSTIMGTAGNSTFAIPVSNTAFSLKPSTTYHYRVEATNSKGTTVGTDVVFTTKAESPPPPPSEKPSVITEAASEITSNAATLNGSVNPHGGETTYKFEYGLAKESLKYSTGSLSAGSGTTSQKVKGIQVALSPSTTYWFRISATNSLGTTVGSELSFTTPAMVTSWSILSTPTPTGATSSQLASASCTASTACTSVGNYVNSGGTRMPLAERWNGTTWAAQTPPSPTGAVSSLLSGVSCTSSTACAAVGYYNDGTTDRPFAETWNGISWTVQTTPSPSGATNIRLRAVSCTSSTACTAVGSYESGSSTLTLGMRWNGTAWTIQSTPNPSGSPYSSLKGVSCTSSTACTAAGRYETSTGAYQTLAEFWNGSTWAVQSTATTSGLLEGASCTSSTACTAVGGKFVSGTPERGLLERWNGTSWSTQTNAEPSGSEAGELHGVSCVSATSCTAVGFYYYAGGTSAPLIERWNGSAWSAMTAPNPTGSTYTWLSSVACTSTTECIATGYYRDSSGTDLALTMKSS